MTFFKDYSIKNKLIAIILLVCFLVTGTGFTFFIIDEISRQKEMLNNEILSNTAIVGEITVSTISFEDRKGAKDLLQKLLTNPVITECWLYDTSDKIFAMASRMTKQDSVVNPGKEISGQFINGTLHIVKPITYYDVNYGTIYVRASTDIVDKKIRDFLLKIFLVLLVMLLFTYFLANKLQGIISKPILDLAKVTKRISEKEDYTVRVKIKGDDEIGILYGGFNNMLEQIHIKEEERDKAEAEKLRLDSIINNTTDLVAMANVDTSLIYMNQAGLDLLNWSKAEDIKNKKIPEAHPDWAYKIVKETGIPAALEYGTWQGETAIVSSKGKIIPVIQVILCHKTADNEVDYISTIMRDITALKQAELSIRQAHAEMQQIFDHSAVGMFRTNVEGNIILANPAILDISGYNSLEDLNTVGMKKVYENPADREKLIKLALNGTVHNFETRFIRKDGKVKEVIITAYPIFDSNNKFKYFEGNIVDITELKQAEKALWETGQMLRLVLDNIPVRVFWKDQNCVYLGGNQPFAGDAGLTNPDDIVGKSDFDFPWSREEANAFRTDDQLVMKSGKSRINFEEEQTQSDGITKWLQTSKIPMRDAEGKIIGVLGTYQDITERKKAVEEVRRLRNYLSNIIDSMPSVIIGVDGNGNVTQWNKTVEINTDITENEAKGKLLSDILPQMKSEMEKIIKSIKTRQIIQEQKKSDTIEKNAVFEDLTIYPLITNGVEGAVIRIDDVTEKVRMSEMMIQSEKMLSVGGLAAGMAHEINNPLAGMMQTAEVMANRLRDNLQIKANVRAAEEAGTSMKAIERFMIDRGIPRMITTIIESGKRVAQIVENMLSFSRKSDASISTHDLSMLVDKTINLASTDYDLKKHFDFKMIDIQRNYDNTMPSVSCESIKIQQVLLNIFRNGAQAMQDAKIDQPKFIIRTRYEKSKRMAFIEIEDNGPGMDEETRKRVFEPFFTTKSVGVGTGLGLSVSYFIIVENHSGELSVESTPGKGAKFIIGLPVN